MAIPAGTLEAAARDWYEFRDGSFDVKLWLNSQWVVLGWAAPIAGPLLPIFMPGQLDASSLITWGPIILGTWMTFFCVFTCYVQNSVVPRVKHEVNERLAAPLSRALASSGWTVEFGYAVPNRYRPAPQGLETDRCMIPGWFWLDFKPAGPLVGAPPPATAYQGDIGTSEQQPMLAYQGIN
jgi:hypothetical protein